MVRRVGVSPTTSGLRGPFSGYLSYRRVKVEPPLGLAPSCRPYRGRESLSILRGQNMVWEAGFAPAISCMSRRCFNWLSDSHENRRPRLRSRPSAQSGLRGTWKWSPARVTLPAIKRFADVSVHLLGRWTAQIGASGRTRTDDFLFTKEGLLLLRHGGVRWARSLKQAGGT